MRHRTDVGQRQHQRKLDREVPQVDAVGGIAQRLAEAQAAGGIEMVDPHRQRQQGEDRGQADEEGRAAGHVDHNGHDDQHERKRDQRPRGHQSAQHCRVECHSSEEIEHASQYVGIGCIADQHRANHRRHGQRHRHRGAAQRGQQQPECGIGHDLGRQRPRRSVERLVGLETPVMRQEQAQHEVPRIVPVIDVEIAPARHHHRLHRRDQPQRQ